MIASDSNGEVKVSDYFKYYPRQQEVIHQWSFREWLDYLWDVSLSHHSSYKWWVYNWPNYVECLPNTILVGECFEECLFGWLVGNVLLVVLKPFVAPIHVHFLVLLVVVLVHLFLNVCWIVCLLVLCYFLKELSFSCSVLVFVIFALIVCIFVYFSTLWLNWVVV